MFKITFRIYIITFKLWIIIVVATSKGTINDPRQFHWTPFGGVMEYGSNPVRSRSCQLMQLRAIMKLKSKRLEESMNPLYHANDRAPLKSRPCPNKKESNVNFKDELAMPTSPPWAPHASYMARRWRKGWWPLVHQMDNFKNNRHAMQWLWSFFCKQLEICENLNIMGILTNIGFSGESMLCAGSFGYPPTGSNSPFWISHVYHIWYYVLDILAGLSTLKNFKPTTLQFPVFISQVQRSGTTVTGRAQ